MAEKLSTGFVDAINTVGSVKSVMANGVIGLYSGPQPSNADEAETGDLLLLLTQDSLEFTPGVATNGLNMGLSVEGVLSKDATEVWSGLGLPAAGSGVVAGYFRWYDNAMVTGASTTAIRVDGTISVTPDYEMQMSNTTIVTGVAAVVNSFTSQLPRT